jgi:hypothetical protein
MFEHGSWFRLGRAAGQLAGNRRTHGLPFTSREEDWCSTIEHSRATRHRWQSFMDGWVTGFATADGQPTVSANVVNRRSCASRCDFLTDEGQRCQQAAALLRPDGRAFCAAHGHKWLMASEEAQVTATPVGAGVSSS